MGNPLISHELVRDRSRSFEREAASRRQVSSALTDHLASNRMFAACGKKELRAVAKAARIGVVRRDTTIMTEGEDGKTMYVILSGSAKVTRNGRRLATIGPGDTVGELALLTKQPRAATVVATSDMEVAVISRKSFAKLLDAAPAFQRKLLESLANVVRELDKKVV